MNLILRILKPYIGICKHLPVYSTICRYIFEFRFVPEDSSTTRPCRPKVRTASQESSHSRCRGLQIPPARLTAARSSLSFQSIRTPTSSWSLRARFARATCPRDVLNDQFRGLDASSGRAVVSIADADQPLAITREQLFRTRHPGTQRQPDFHRTPRPLNARGGEPCTGARVRRILALSYGLTPGFRIEGSSFRIRPRRFACRGLRFARDAR